MKNHLLAAVTTLLSMCVPIPAPPPSAPVVPAPAPVLAR